MVEGNLFKFEPHFVISIGGDKPKQIEYNKYAYAYTFSDFIKLLKKGKFGFDIKFVFGTTRHKPSQCLHPGFISDAAYIPEITQKLLALRNFRKKIKLESLFDIDLSDDDLAESNLILTGDGEVNYIVKRLLDHYGKTLMIKYEAPDRPFFDTGFEEEKIFRKTHHMYGVVQLVKNPWSISKDRFIIHTGGIGPVGTISALRWLLKILEKPRSYDSPMYVVKGEEKQYVDEFSGYKNLCDKCCRIVEEGEYFYKGKIGNVIAVTPVYPLL